MADYTLDEIATALDQAPRQGADTDEPEGSRYITLSDSVAQEIAQALRRYDLSRRVLAGRH